MISTNSSNDYVDKAVKHYSSLFGLPSYRQILYLLFVSCLGYGVLSAFLMWSPSERLVVGLIFGTIMFLTTTISDFLIHLVWMKKDPVFNRRRCSALSLFSNLIWLGFLILASIISVALKTPGFSMKLFLPGFCAALILRLLVFCTTSFASFKGALISSVLQPSLFIASSFTMGFLIGYSLEVNIAVFLLLSTAISVAAIFLFTHFINRIGRAMLATDTLLLFKFFIANWLENISEPLETFFEKSGDVRDINISVLAFRCGQKLKALILVPTFHSGPFKNVGSSLLSYSIQRALENRLDCVVSIPHGPSGHASDIVSQLESQKILESTLNSIQFSSFDSNASPFIRIQRDEANVGCQVFGNLVLLTLTLSPKTMEDLPSELDYAILSEAKKRGFSSAVVVDAHNSINGSPNLDQAVATLKSASVTSIEKSLQLSRSSFEIGAAKVVPQGFSLKDGMGPGGITVIVTKVGDQKTAYVTIDGNNMISGLREKILSTLQEAGITGGEILTTDTHAVNGITLAERGYHPIGEVMDQEKLISYIKQVVENALSDLELAEVSHQTYIIPNVKVVGEEQVSNLCLLTEKAVNEAKKLALFIFPSIGVILAALLFL